MILQTVPAGFDLAVINVRALCGMESSPQLLQGRVHDFPICASWSLVLCLTPGTAGSHVTCLSLPLHALLAGI